MKLDYDFIRELLLLVESQADGYKNLNIESFRRTIPGSDFVRTRYHLKYLIDAKLVEGSLDDDSILDITPLGRDYLDHIRDDSIWGKAKAKIQPFDNVPLSIVSQVAASCISSSLGL